MKSWLYTALFVVSLTTYAAPQQTPASTPDELLQQLRAKYEEILALEEGEKWALEEKVLEAQGLAKRIYEHSESTENQKQTAVTVEAYCLFNAAATDSQYLEAYREVVERLVALFPSGHTTAGEAQLRLLQLEYFPPRKEDVFALLTEMEQFAGLYPNFPSAGYTLAIYARGLYFQDEVQSTFLVLDEGIRLFPEDKTLKNTKGLFGLQGQQAKLATQTVAGEAFDLSTLQGKVVLIDFWASWCGPCRELGPKLVALYEKYQAQGLEIVAFSQDFKMEDLEKYLGEHEYPWTQLYEPNAVERVKILNQYFVSWIPTLFLVGKDGKMHTVGLGSEIELIERKVVEALAR